MEEKIEIFIAGIPPSWWGIPKPNDAVLLFNLKQTNQWFQILSINIANKGIKMELLRRSTLGIDLMTGNGAREFVVYYEIDKNSNILYHYPPEESQYYW